MSEHEAPQHGSKANTVKGATKPQAQPVPKTALQSLPLSKQIVVNAYLDKQQPSFLVKKLAYRAAHPNTTDGTACVEGHRVLTQPKVLTAIDEELKARGWDKDRVLFELDRNVSASWDAGKLTDHRDGVMDIAKVQRLIVDQVESKTIQDKELDEMRKVVSDVLKGEGTHTNG